VIFIAPKIGRDIYALRRRPKLEKVLERVFVLYLSARVRAQVCSNTQITF